MLVARHNIDKNIRIIAASARDMEAAYTASFGKTLLCRSCPIPAVNDYSLSFTRLPVDIHTVITKNVDKELNNMFKISVKLFGSPGNDNDGLVINKRGLNNFLFIC